MAEVFNKIYMVKQFWSSMWVRYVSEKGRNWTASSPPITGEKPLPSSELWAAPLGFSNFPNKSKTLKQGVQSTVYNPKIRILDFRNETRLWGPLSSRCWRVNTRIYICVWFSSPRKSRSRERFTQWLQQGPSEIPIPKTRVKWPVNRFSWKFSALPFTFFKLVQVPSKDLCCLCSSSNISEYPFCKVCHLSLSLWCILKLQHLRIPSKE